MSHEDDASKSAKDLASQLISVTRAAQIGGVTPAYIRRLIRDKRIDGVKIGRHWLTTEAAVRQYVNTKRPPGRPKNNE